MAFAGSFFVLDQDIPHHIGLEAKVADLITPSLEGMGYELVRVAIMGRERPTVQIMADRADGARITVEDCERISHDASAAIDVNDPIPGAWTLEVSSAGIDRPLTRTKDFNRYAGFDARIELNFPGPGGRKRFTGVLLGADEETARMRTEGAEEISLKRSEIRKAKLVLTDRLIKFSAPDGVLQ